MRFRFDWQHGLMVAGFPIITGAMNFLYSQPPEGVVNALLSGHVKPLIVGMAAGAIMTVLSTLKKSWAFPDGVTPPSVTSFLPHSVDEKPATEKDVPK